MLKSRPDPGKPPGEGNRPLVTQSNVSFVIRLWLEPRAAPGPPEWRGHVFHVQTRKGAYFRQMADLLKFVEQKAGVTPPEP